MGALNALFVLGRSMGFIGKICGTFLCRGCYFVCSLVALLGGWKISGVKVCRSLKIFCMCGPVSC